MNAKVNPLKLNALQLKTLAIFQFLAATVGGDAPEPEGARHTGLLPSPHGNHFHVGPAVVMTADATGLSNEAVWKALERKGLIVSQYPSIAIVTKEGMDYETGVTESILHRAHH